MLFRSKGVKSCPGKTDDKPGALPASRAADLDHGVRELNGLFVTRAEEGKGNLREYLAIKPVELDASEKTVKLSAPASGGRSGAASPTGRRASTLVRCRLFPLFGTPSVIVRFRCEGGDE